MSYIGTKIFIGICVNTYLSMLYLKHTSVWLKNQNTMIEEIKKSAAK